MNHHWTTPHGRSFEAAASTGAAVQRRPSTGPEMVLLHGFTGAPESWDAIVRALPMSTSVLRPTLFGHGLEFTSVDGDVQDFDGEVDRLLELIRRHTEHPVALVGYSLGGRLALRMLLREPGLFEAAVLISVNPGLDSGADQANRCAGDADWVRALREEGISSFVASWEAQPLFRATQAQVLETALDTQRRIRLGRSPEGLARSLECCGLGSMPPMWADLARLSVPTTWMVGAADPKFRGLALRALQTVPAGRLEVVAGAGHNVVLECPRAVIATLTRLLGTSGTPMEGGTP